MYIKHPVEIHHIKQREGEPTEAFMEIFKEESMHVSGAQKCMRISGFMHGNKTRRKTRRAEKTAKKGEAPNKEKAAAIFMVQPWQRIRRQKTTQSFSAGQEISFSPLRNNSGQETSIVIEAKVEGNLIYRMRWRALNKHPDELHGHQIPITIQWYHWPPRSQKNPSGPIYRSLDAKVPSGRRNNDHPQQYRNTNGVQNGGSLSEKGRMELGNLLKDNLDIFAWKPADMTGVPRSIAEHHLNIREDHCDQHDQGLGYYDQLNRDSAVIGAENIRKMEHEVPNRCDNITNYKDSDQEDGGLPDLPNFSATNEFASVCEQGKDNIDVNTAQELEEVQGRTLKWMKIMILTIQTLKKRYNRGDWMLLVEELDVGDSEHGLAHAVSSLYRANPGEKNASIWQETRELDNNIKMNKALEFNDVANGCFYKRLIYKKISAYDLESL
ncbi:hypothetical protein Tco_1431167 [Tanacetum coccineum]